MPNKTERLHFSRLLRPNLRFDDDDWTFDVPGLPSPLRLNRSEMVKIVVIQTDMKQRKHSLSLRVEKVDSNRAIRKDPLDKFILLSLEGFRALPRQSSDNASPNAVTSQGQLCTGREISEYSIRLLRSGITLNGVSYNFYGHSNSQLKSRSCFLFAASKEQISQKVEALGDFSKMKTVAKKAKRVGLLFSAAKTAAIVQPDRCEDIADVEVPGYIFTDGCGLIAPILARDLARRDRIMFRDRRYTPSVFQIRYLGYKGVVTVDPRMSEGRTHLKFRSSMRKFSGGDDYSFAVVDHSKPFAYGYLNDETIILLNALGITEETLLRKQNEHFQLLSSATSDYRAAFCFLSYVNQLTLAEDVFLRGVEAVKPRITKLVNAEYVKMQNKKGEERCRIFVRKSRLLFGVCDAWDVLEKGECAVKVTMEGDGKPYALKGTEVSVIRNPCLHPGDWQKFKVVEKPQLSHLVDCIVFSVKGSRPAADLMSGGDLDGDQFFVCWDQDLIPSTLSQPAQYPGGREPVRFRPITDDDRLVFFAKYTNASLGRVKNLYLDWARISGPMSPECQQLNRLFSQCVDGNPIKIPDMLQKAPKAVDSTPAFILDVLHSRAKATIRAPALEHARLDGLDMDSVELLLSRDDIAISEFDAVLMAHRWSQIAEVPFENLLYLFDFNALDPVQQAWVIGQVPASEHIPALITNALCSSNILQREELSHFQLDSPSIRWKRIYGSDHDRLGTFLDAAAANLEVFHRKLILFSLDERLSLAVYLPQKLEQSRDCLIDNVARLFAFPHSQGRERQSRLCLPTKKNYHLYFDANVFQLFEGKRESSWVFMTRPPSRNNEYASIPSVGDRRRQRQADLDRGSSSEVCASIALDKFSKALQTHVGRVHRTGVSAAEIYVISNRDVASMRSLDQWLEYIDTTDRLPLFPQHPNEYTIPTLNGTVSDSDPPMVQEVTSTGDPSRLDRVESVQEYLRTFEVLLMSDEKALLLKCFRHVLDNIPSLRVEAKPVLEAMASFLRKAPFLSIAYSQTPTTSDWTGEVLPLLRSSSLSILQAFVLAAITLGSLVVEPFQHALSYLQDGDLSFESLTSLLEVLSLTIRSSDLALDMLAVLEPETTRLVVGDHRVVSHSMRMLSGIAMDHIDEAAKADTRREDLLDMKLCDKQDDGYDVVEVSFRIDARGGTPLASSHVRFTAASPATNDPRDRRYSIDALVVHSELGRARFKCLHPLPSYFRDCSWTIQDCGPFVTSKTMFDAVRDLGTSLEQCCGVAGPILGVPISGPPLAAPTIAFNWRPIEKLNYSQNAAVLAALTNPLVCLWGPPGTGKTETIVEMICGLQECYPDSRVLVTAPTHNAVDNVMRRYMHRIQNLRLSRTQSSPNVLRVSTEVRKVAEDLRKYTCDAMAGQEIYGNREAMEKAIQAVERSDTVFTTCIGAGIGLLRSQYFDTVIVDEASQQTEPASLVPLVKGCARAVLVGDHVQLRPTVGQNALALVFDVSLFERLYTGGNASVHGETRTDRNTTQGSEAIKNLMLDTQYRMHPNICSFSSTEFYEGKLKTGIDSSARPLNTCKFQFPLAKDSSKLQLDIAERSRLIFLNCCEPETPGQKSKTNLGQAALCAHVCELLMTPGEATEGSRIAETLTMQHSVAVLTPYTSQAQLLRQKIARTTAGIEVSSIDGFQGREADIVVFVTVRCNEHREIGFLKDLRRMNVALTRAKTALIVIGHRATLTEGDPEEPSTQVWKRLLDDIAEVEIEMPVIG